MIYARYEGPSCAEPLSDHLANVAEKARRLAERLAKGHGEYAELAAALHDLGKALHNVLHQGRRPLSFPYHEVLSAAVAGYYLWNDGRDPAEIVKIVRPVLLHHQGLRGVSAATYSEGLASISIWMDELRQRGSLGQLINGMRNVLNNVAGRLSPSAAKTLRDIALKLSEKWLVKAVESASTLMPRWASPPDLATARVARHITAAVMVADNCVARDALRHCGNSASRYVEDVEYLCTKTLTNP